MRNTVPMKSLILVPLLSGCAMIAGQAALSPQVIQAAQLADYAKTGADVGSYLATGRSMADNAVSKALGMDCQMIRLLDDREYCIDNDVD